MQGLHRVFNMSDYGSTHLNNASLYLKMAEYWCMPLNVPENVSINFSDYAWVLKITPCLKFATIMLETSHLVPK